MSGPITCILIGDPITALLSAAGIRAAEAIYQGYARAEALRGEHDAARSVARGIHYESTRQGRQALEREAELAEARFEQLIVLADQLGAAAQVRATRPVRPEGTDFITVAAYTRALHSLADELQSILVIAADRLKSDSVEQAVAFDLPADALYPYGAIVQRLLARIAHLGAPPEHIATLALELERTPPGERANLLAMELRQRIQSHLEAAQQRLVQEATATIVRQSLKDLGYQVEDVADTLFVEGGVMHFRRPGWGNYLVRMRVDPSANTANFNVVRAIDPADRNANEATVLDHIAEDRWCAEFPALLNTLAKRGVTLAVTRRLEAGEMPVQKVERDELPVFDHESGSEPADASAADGAPPAPKARARSIR
ncbi:MAG: hypothetical protein ABJB04_02830 [Betaproteobacteria bacterium]